MRTGHRRPCLPHCTHGALPPSLAHTGSSGHPHPHLLSWPFLETEGDFRVFHRTGATAAQGRAQNLLARAPGCHLVLFLLPTSGSASFQGRKYACVYLSVCVCVYVCVRGNMCVCVCVYLSGDMCVEHVSVCV